MLIDLQMRLDWPPCLMLIKALSTSEMGFIASRRFLSLLLPLRKRQSIGLHCHRRGAACKREKITGQVNCTLLVRTPCARLSLPSALQFFSFFSIASKRLASRRRAHPLDAIRSNWQPTKSMKMARLSALHPNISPFDWSSAAAAHLLYLSLASIRN